ncbi:MAG: hypothetical protein N2544_11290 [Burkholderiales bacterium]|nr:hypothetical protein [Burkholderiales bacterium]
MRAKLASELANPVPSLISVPFPSNGERGPVDGGRQCRLSLRPVVPFALTPDLNLIPRLIVPVVGQSGILPGAGNQSDLSDTRASLFRSPSRPTSGGWIRGTGAVVLVPTRQSRPSRAMPRTVAGPRSAGLGVSPGAAAAAEISFSVPAGK